MAAGEEGELHQEEERLDCGSNATMSINYKSSRHSLHSVSCQSLNTRHRRGHAKTLGSSTHDLVIQQAEILSTRNLAEPAEQEEEEWKYVDQADSAYSWLALVCCIVVLLASTMLGATVGIFLVEFMESSSPQNRGGFAWICTIQQGMTYLMGPLAGILVDKIGARTTIMIGCLGTGLSLCVASLTSNFYVLLLTYGILAGGFLCCILIPATVCAGDYFVKYKVLALTTSTCCLPLIYSFAVPITTAAIQSYGWRTTNIYIAGVFIQVTALAALLRPRRLSKKWKVLEESEEDLTMTTLGQLRKSSHSLYTDSHYSLFGEDTIPLSKLSLYCSADYNNSDVLNPAKRLIDMQGSQMFYQLSFKSELSLAVIPELAPLQMDSPVVEKDLMDVKDQNSPHLEVNLKVEHIPIANTEVAFENRKTFLIRSPLKKLCFPIFQHPLVHWRMCILILHNLLWGYTSSSFYILLPELCKSVSISITEVGHLYIIVGITGFGGRLFTVILCRLVADLGKGTGITVSMVIQSGAMIGLSLATKFECFAVLVGVYSFGYGVTACLTTPTIIELHGDNHLALVFGLEMLSYGIGTLISAPFSAFMYHQLGTYSFGYQFAGGCAFVGALVFLPHVITKWIQDSKLRAASKSPC